MCCMIFDLCTLAMFVRQCWFCNEEPARLQLKKYVYSKKNDHFKKWNRTLIHLWSSPWSTALLLVWVTRANFLLRPRNKSCLNAWSFSSSSGEFSSQSLLMILWSETCSERCRFHTTVSFTNRQNMSVTLAFVENVIFRFEGPYRSYDAIFDFGCPRGIVNFKPQLLKSWN
jgi:hypothetical protein